MALAVGLKLILAMDVLGSIYNFWVNCPFKEHERKDRERMLVEKAAIIFMIFNIATNLLKKTTTLPADNII